LEVFRRLVLRCKDIGLPTTSRRSACQGRPLFFFHTFPPICIEKVFSAFFVRAPPSMTCQPPWSRGREPPSPPVVFAIFRTLAPPYIRRSPRLFASSPFSRPFPQWIISLLFPAFYLRTLALQSTCRFFGNFSVPFSRLPQGLFFFLPGRCPYCPFGFSSDIRTVLPPATFELQGRCFLCFASPSFDDFFLPRGETIRSAHF